MTNNNQTLPTGLSCLNWCIWWTWWTCLAFSDNQEFSFVEANQRQNSIQFVQHHLLPLQSSPVLNKFKQSPNRNYFWISDIDIHSREKKESCLSGTIMKFNLCLIQKLHVKDICRIIMGSSGDRIGSDDGLNGLADLAPSFVPPFFPFQRSFFPSD